MKKISNEINEIKSKVTEAENERNSVYEEYKTSISQVKPEG